MLIGTWVLDPLNYNKELFIRYRQKYKKVSLNVHLSLNRYTAQLQQQNTINKRITDII